MRTASAQVITSATTSRRLIEAARLAALALVFGTCAALVRRYLDFHLGVPGHTGLAWIAVLTAGALTIRRRWAGTVIGVTTALMGAPVGLGHPFGDNLLLYGLAGLALDAVFAIPAVRRRGAVGAAAAGTAAHAAKFAVVTLNALTAVTVKNVVVVGLGIALVNHLLFGLMGGLAGAGIFYALRAALRRLRR
ncbi:MAG: hypothetical protein FJ029_07710 [Actinobacteria bacterium]|nr:hypothetical protein [Actinomycetota bacterium]